MDLNFLKDSHFNLFHFILQPVIHGVFLTLMSFSILIYTHTAVIQHGHLSHILRDEDHTETPRAAFIILLAFLLHSSSFLAVLKVYTLAPKLCLWRVNHINMKEPLKSVYGEDVTVLRVFIHTAAGAAFSTPQSESVFVTCDVISRLELVVQS